MDGQAWLLVTVSAGSSSTLRVYVWRTLRSAGALYLQQSVALLPRRPETERIVARLLDRVRRDGGEANVLAMTIADADDEAAMVARFSAERTDEYGEVCERVPAFVDEIALERRRGRATYTEFEESEADLARLRTWLGRIKARDYFGAPGRDEAEAAVERCARLLEEFEAEAVAAEVTPVVPARVESERLRSVEGGHS